MSATSSPAGQYWPAKSAAAGVGLRSDGHR